MDACCNDECPGMEIHLNVLLFIHPPNCPIYHSKVTVGPRSSDPFYSVSHYIEWVATSWTYSKATMRRKEVVLKKTPASLIAI